MDIAVFLPHELPLVLGTLISVAVKPSALTELEQQFLRVVIFLHQGNVLVGELSPITPSEVAQVITESGKRLRLLEMVMVMAMVDGEIAPNQQRAVFQIAEAFAVGEQKLRRLHKSASKYKRLARMDMMRRCMGKVMCRRFGERGIASIQRMVTYPLNDGEDPEVAWKYRQLGLLSKGTLGRAFWEFCTQRCFSFPGEANGLPESMVFHDIGHILSGYDTDSQGEILQAAFQAGFVREGGFMFLLFVILENISFGFQFTTRELMHAFQRGMASQVDFSHDWNFWDAVDLSVEELRDRLKIAPGISS